MWVHFWFPEEVRTYNGNPGNCVSVSEKCMNEIHCRCCLNHLDASVAQLQRLQSKCFLIELNRCSQRLPLMCFLSKIK